MRQLTVTGVESLNQLLEAADTVAGRVGQGDKFLSNAIWYRGDTAPGADDFTETFQSTVTLPLVPSVFRAPKHEENEKSAANLFRHAAAIEPSCPPAPDLAHWTCLMRHHGVPSRLLDWTESILIAAFFAVEVQKSHEQRRLLQSIAGGLGVTVQELEKIAEENQPDGVIWVLNPRRLNRCQKDQAGYVDLTGEESEFLLKKSTGRYLTQAETEQLERQSQRFVALAARAPIYNRRMLAQQSRYTVHFQGTSMQQLWLRHQEQNEKCRNYLGLITIAGQSRGKIREQLKQLGIHPGSVYADLDHLAGSIRDRTAS